jgi:adenylate kinase
MESVKNFTEFLNERELPDVQGKILIIMGPPGSGKGTFSTKLAERNGFVHISTGDLIRNSDDKELKAKIAKGEYADDKTMVRMLKKELEKVDLSKGIIFDGFPRTIKQAGMLDSLLGKLGVGLNHAIYLDLNEEIAKKRILKRAEKENRKDDKDSEVVGKRFRTYEEKTSPLIDLYKKSRRLKKFDASQGSEEVYKAVTKSLGIKTKDGKKKEEKST